jgi:hypothetical protein
VAVSPGHGSVRGRHRAPHVEHRGEGTEVSLSAPIRRLLWVGLALLRSTTTDLGATGGDRVART